MPPSTCSRRAMIYKHPWTSITQAARTHTSTTTMDAVDDTAATLAGPEPEPESSSSFLTVLLDLHAEHWVHHSEYSLWSVLPNVLVFMNAHLALDSSNQLAVIGYNSAGAKMLHSTADLVQASDTSGPQISGAMIRQFKNLDESLLREVHSQIQAATETANPEKRTSVAGPLSLALSYLNRHVNKSKLGGHILVVSAEMDNVGFQYITAMNSIFTAQKMRIPIDSAIFGPPNTFLQQAADFTGGSYLEIRPPTALEALEENNILPIFMSVYLTEPSIRPHVNLATKPDVDFSAVCFVSKSVIEIGMVCSVCLCIMKEVPSSNQCPVCHTPYEAKNAKAP